MSLAGVNLSKEHLVAYKYLVNVSMSIVNSKEIAHFFPLVIREAPKYNLFLHTLL